jgi:glycosyltransferase involved in cell wall biosynthesis
MEFKYRIAYLLTPVEFGGAEKVNLNFLRNVDRECFDVHTILFFRPWEEDTFFLKECKELGFPMDMVPVSFGGQDHLWLIRRFIMVFSFLRQGQFDLLHCHGYIADIVGLLSARILGTRTISTCHGFTDNDRKLSLYNRLDRLALRFSNRIIAVSDDIQKKLIRSGIKANRIRVIPNCVQTEIDEASFLKDRLSTRQHLGFSTKDFILGYIGRLSKEKGLSHLIEAVSLSRRRSCPVKLLIIGDGPQHTELSAAVSREGLEQDIVFTGFHSNISHFFPAMDVFVLPSLTEGTPVALLEAMAHGIPVIASSVGGVPGIIESGKEGLLVPPGRPREIATQIQMLCNDPSLRASLASAAQQKVRVSYDIKQWTRQIEQEYLRTICAGR